MQEKTFNNIFYVLLIIALAFTLYMYKLAFIDGYIHKPLSEKETNYKYVIGFNKNGDIISRDSLTLQDIEYIDTMFSVYKMEKQQEWLEKELK